MYRTRDYEYYIRVLARVVLVLIGESLVFEYMYGTISTYLVCNDARREFYMSSTRVPKLGQRLADAHRPTNQRTSGHTLRKSPIRNASNQPWSSRRDACSSCRCSSSRPHTPVSQHSRAKCRHNRSARADTCCNTTLDARTIRGAGAACTAPDTGSSCPGVAAGFSPFRAETQIGVTGGGYTFYKGTDPIAAIPNWRLHDETNQVSLGWMELNGNGIQVNGQMNTVSLSLTNGDGDGCMMNLPRVATVELRASDSVNVHGTFELVMQMMCGYSLVLYLDSCAPGAYQEGWCGIGAECTDGSDFTCSCLPGFDGRAADNGWIECEEIACTRPSHSNYDFTNVVEGSLNGASFDVTGLECAIGYAGTPVATVCSTAGPYSVSGCSEITCASVTSATGYDFTNVDEYSLYGSEFEVTGVVCAAGYEGTATAVICTVDDGPYTMTGCSALSTTISRTILCDRYGDQRGEEAFCTAFVSDGQLPLLLFSGTCASCLVTVPAFTHLCGQLACAVRRSRREHAEVQEGPG